MYMLGVLQMFTMLDLGPQNNQLLQIPGHHLYKTDKFVNYPFKEKNRKSMLTAILGYLRIYREPSQRAHRSSAEACVS